MSPEYSLTRTPLASILKSLLISSFLIAILITVIQPVSALPANRNMLSADESNQIVGYLQSGSGSPIEGAMVLAQRRRNGETAIAISDASGNYTLTLGSGLWSITAQHSTATVPNDWYWNDSPIVFNFLLDGENETEVQNFRFLSSQSVVRGFVKMPDGSAPPFDVVVSLKTAEGYGISRPARDYDGFFWRVARSGEFTFQLLPQNPDYVGPPPQTINLQPGDLIDVGEIRLIHKSSAIQASIVDPQGNQVGGVDLIAWSAESGASVSISSPTETMTVPVVAGDWYLKPAVPVDAPYIFDGDLKSVTVGVSQTVVVSDFVVQPAPNLITGTWVDASGLPVELDGWVTAEDALGNGVRATSVQSGTFHLYLPDGTYNLRPSLSPDNLHLAVDPVAITVANSQTLAVDLPVLSATTTVKAIFWDPREEEAVASLGGSVLGTSGESFNQAVEHPVTSVYQQKLPMGEWAIGYGFNPSTHLPLNRAFSLEVDGTPIQEISLPVAKRDSAVTGRVMGADGNPLADAFVHVRGESAVLEQVYLQVQTDSDGRYYINLPHGSYTLWSDSDGASQNGWIPPATRRLNIGVKVIRPGIDLTFRQSNMTLTGNITRSDAAPITGPIKLWAQTGDGGNIMVDVQPSGFYTLPLLRDKTWEIEAFYETEDAIYRLAEEVTPTGNQTLDLVLNDLRRKPSPQIFPIDTAYPADLYVDNRLKLFIPARTLPVTGTAYIQVSPISPQADKYFHQQLFPGYSISLFDSFGNPLLNSNYQSAFVTLRYDQDLIDAKSLNERQIRPIAMNRSNQRWEQPDLFVLDTVNNQLTVEVDLFSSYTLLAGEPNPMRIYLPALQK